MAIRSTGLLLKRETGAPRSRASVWPRSRLHWDQGSRKSTPKERPLSDDTFYGKKQSPNVSESEYVKRIQMVKTMKGLFRVFREPSGDACLVCNGCFVRHVPLMQLTPPNPECRVQSYKAWAPVSRAIRTARTRNEGRTHSPVRDQPH